MKQVTYEQAMTLRRAGEKVTLYKPIQNFGSLQLIVIDDLLNRGAFFAVDDETKEEHLKLVNDERLQEVPPPPEKPHDPTKTPTGLDIKKMQKLRDKGMTIEAIAAECGCSNPTVSRYTEPMKHDVGKMQALRNAHWSVKMIADEMGCSESTVRRLTTPAKAKKGEQG